MLKLVRRVLNIRLCKALRKLDGSIGVDLFFKSDKLIDNALAKGEIGPESDSCWQQNEGMVLRACSIVLT